MMEMDALRDDLRMFCDQYTRQGNRARLLAGRPAALARLFIEFASTAKVDSLALDAFSDWVHGAAERLCLLDDLVDKSRLRPSIARSILFDPSAEHEMAFAHAMGLTQESFARILSGQGDEGQQRVFEMRSGLMPEVYADLRQRATAAARSEQSTVEAMGLDYLDFFILKESALERMDEAFRIEARHRDGDRINEAGVAATVLRQTQPVAFLGEVLGRTMHADGIGNPVIRGLQDFLADYAQLCVGLDHLVDVEADAASGCFNFVISRHTSIDGPHRQPAPGGLWDELARSGALAEVIRLLTDLAEHATWALSTVAHPGLKDLFERLAGGMCEALRILMEHGQLLDIPDPKRRDIKRLLMKPFPWEELAFEDVFAA